MIFVNEYPIFNHSLLTLAVLIGSSRLSLSADLFTKHLKNIYNSWGIEY